MYRVVTGTKHSRVERGIYRADRRQPGGRADLGRLRPHRARLLGGRRSCSSTACSGCRSTCPLAPLGPHFTGLVPSLSWNTAVSFVTNTNWQAYSGESTMTLPHPDGRSGGAELRLGRRRHRRRDRAGARLRPQGRRRALGNFWVDLVRITLRILLPIAVIGAIVFVGAGMIQNFSRAPTCTRSPAATQHITGGPVASQEVIKELGTNGGGFYNANRAHPFENPTTWTNWLQIFLLLVISFSLPRTFGRMVGSNKHGLRDRRRDGDHGDRQRHRASTCCRARTAARCRRRSERRPRAPRPDSAFRTRRRSPRATTLTSTGAVDSFHDSYTALGGGVPIAEHDARRGRARRHRLRPVRHARPRRSSRSSWPG